MKTLLVLAPHPEMSDAVRAALNPEKYRIVHRISIEEAEPLLTRGVLDGCLLDVELTNVQGIWVLEKLRRRMPHCPIIAYATSREWQWEEEAYLQGVSHVLTKPVRPRLLNVLLDRLWTVTLPVRAKTRVAPARASEEGRPLKAAHTASQALSVLHDFSGILTHSLCADGLLKQFL